MVSLLCLFVLLSGALRSYAITDLNSTEFKNKLRNLPASVPVFIIHSNTANNYKVLSTLREVENSSKNKVYLYEIFGNSYPPSTCRVQKYRNWTASSQNTKGSAARKTTSAKNQQKTRNLEEIKNIMTSMTNTPIFVVSIYSKFDRKHIKYVKCWIRNTTLKRSFIVSRVNGQNVALRTTIHTVDNSVSKTPQTVQIVKTIDDKTLTIQNTDLVNTHTTENSVQRSTAESKSEVDSDSFSDLSDSGTNFWVASSFASKSNSGPATGRSKPQARKDRTARSIPDDKEYYDAHNLKSEHVHEIATDETEQTLPPHTSISNGVRNAKMNDQNGRVVNGDDCESGDLCAFSFAQSRIKVKSIAPPLTNFRQRQPNNKNEGETSGLTKTTSFIPINSQLTREVFLATRPPHGSKNNEETLDNYQPPLRFHGGFNLKQGNIGDGRTSSSESQRSNPKYSIEESLENVPESVDNFYDLDYETDEGSNIWDSIDNGIEKTKKVIQNVKETAKNSYETVKNGVNKLKEIGHDSYRKFINFFS